MGRSNEAWLTQLATPGAEQQGALADLRAALLRGLRRALAGRDGLDDGLLEDAVQDALLRILDRLPQFAGRSRFLTWATSIAIRTALSEIRRRRFKKNISLDELIHDADSRLERKAEATDETALLDRGTIFGKMYEILRRDLSEKQQKALYAELQGFSLDQIAQTLDSNRNAVYKLTHDARKRLRRGLEAEGYKLEQIRAAFVD